MLAFIECHYKDDWRYNVICNALYTSTSFNSGTSRVEDIAKGWNQENSPELNHCKEIMENDRPMTSNQVRHVLLVGNPTQFSSTVANGECDLDQILGTQCVGSLTKSLKGSFQDLKAMSGNHTV